MWEVLSTGQLHKGILLVPRMLEFDNIEQRIRKH